MMRLLLVGAVGLALLVTSSVLVWQVVEAEQERRQANALADAAAHLEDRFFVGHRPQLEWLAAQPLVRGFLTHSSPTPALTTLLEQSRGLLGLEVVYLVSSDGKIVAATDPDFLGINVESRAYYRRALAGLPSYAMSLGLVNHNKGLYASVPVYDDGVVRGLVVFRTSAAELDHWQALVPGLLILDADGRVFSSLDPRWPPGSAGVGSEPLQTRDGVRYRVVRHPLDVVPGNVLVSLVRQAVPWGAILFMDLLVLLLFVSVLLGIRQFRLSRERLNEDRDQKQRELLLSHLMEGIAVFDASGTLSWSNPAFDQLIQRAPDGPSVTLPELWDRRDQGPWLEVLEGRRPWVVFESVLKGSLGAWIPVTAGFTAAGGGYLLSVLDGSERYRSDQLLRQSQKLTVLGQLSGGIAHDLNNMLGVLMGMADLLKMNLAENDPLQESVDLILTTLSRAAALSERMLNFARQTPIDRVSLDMSALLRELRFLARTALPTGTEAEIAVPQGPLLVLGDENLLLSALLNLVLNAGEAMTGGGVVRVETQRKDAVLQIVVQDTGVGMDKATLTRIFEPFFSTKLARKGTGLGLSLVRRTILEHRGTIDVQSQPGTGTKVTLTLPLAPTD